MSSREKLLHLLQRAQARDEAAMEEILKRFRPLIRKLSRDMGSPDREDLEQELSLLVMRIVMAYQPATRRSSPGEDK